jgi:hypothetical protein
MNKKNLINLRLFVAALFMGVLSLTSPDVISNAKTNIPNVIVANIEELYTAVNDPQNAGSEINIAPGVYMLSVYDPMGAPRPNGGRLELQQDMSLLGVVGDRGAVTIDANDLPTSSFNAPPVR